MSATVMSKFKKQSKKNVLDSTVLKYIMQIFNQTIKKCQLAITVPILIENAALYSLLRPEEIKLVKNAFSSDITTSLLCTNRMDSKHQSYLFSAKSETLGNLYESPTIESENSINTEVNILDTAVFKMLKVLYSYPSIHKMAESYQMNISAQSSLFKHYLHYFMEYIISIMLTTPQEENARNMHYKKVWYGHQNALKDIKELTVDLEELRQSKEKEMESVITQYRNDTMIIDRLNLKCLEDLQNMSNKYERKQYMLHTNWETKREELRAKLDTIKTNFETLKNKNLNTTLDLENKRMKTEARLLTLINRFDTEMDERQTEFDELSKTYESNRIEQELLKTAIKLQESTYNLFLKDRQNASRTYFDESSEYFAG